MGTIHCYFCGGKSCKYETYENWLDVPNSHNAIVGLFSNWITDDILATARPSTRIMKQYGVIDQFHTYNIGAIINLQMAGEHQNCGDGISLESGFSYIPEDFMNANIFYYNFGWEDMTTPGLDLALNIAQVISFTLAQGKKVAIHCHAGLGRTGLIIACYLVYSKMFSAKDAIQQVRLHRTLSIQTSRQVGFVWRFEAAVKQLRVVYPDAGTKQVTLATVLRRQKRYLHGTEERILRNIPKIAKILCEKLCNLSKVEVENCGAFEDRKLTQEEMGRVAVLKVMINNDNWTELDKETNCTTLLQLLLDWLVTLKPPFFAEDAVNFIRTQDLITPQQNSTVSLPVADLRHSTSSIHSAADSYTQHEPGLRQSMPELSSCSQPNLATLPPHQVTPPRTLVLPEVRLSKSPPRDSFSLPSPYNTSLPLPSVNRSGKDLSITPPAPPTLTREDSLTTIVNSITALTIAVEGENIPTPREPPEEPLPPKSTTPRVQISPLFSAFLFKLQDPYRTTMQCIFETAKTLPPHKQTQIAKILLPDISPMVVVQFLQRL